MSTWVEGFTEARVNGKWICIDFFQQDAVGNTYRVPCIIGQSMVREALEWNCNVQDLMGPPDELSETVRKECSTKDGTLYGTDEQSWIRWCIVEGNWLSKVDFSIPEHCGFFLRQSIGAFLSNPDDNSMNPDDMLSAQEYQGLDPEAKKAYQYYEYSDPSSNRSIMRDFKDAVIARINAFNHHAFWHDSGHAITLDAVRVLITIS